MTGDPVRWNAEADALAAAWTASTKGRGAQRAWIERDGDRSSEPRPDSCRTHNALVDERTAAAFTLVRKEPDTLITFIDDWGEQRELIEFPVWLGQHGGVDADTVGNFWLGLAEGIVRGTSLA